VVSATDKRKYEDVPGLQDNAEIVFRRGRQRALLGCGLVPGGGAGGRWHAPRPCWAVERQRHTAPPPTLVRPRRACRSNNHSRPRSYGRPRALAGKSGLLHWALYGDWVHTKEFLGVVLVVAFSAAWDQARAEPFWGLPLAQGRVRNIRQALGDGQTCLPFRKHTRTHARTHTHIYTHQAPVPLDHPSRTPDPLLGLWHHGSLQPGRLPGPPAEGRLLHHNRAAQPAAGVLREALPAAAGQRVGDAADWVHDAARQRRLQRPDLQARARQATLAQLCDGGCASVPAAIRSAGGSLPRRSRPPAPAPPTRPTPAATARSGRSRPACCRATTPAAAGRWRCCWWPCASRPCGTFWSTCTTGGAVGWVLSVLDQPALALGPIAVQASTNPALPAPSPLAPHPPAWTCWSPSS
jgi:hypothetical protein